VCTAVSTAVRGVGSRAPTCAGRPGKLSVTKNLPAGQGVQQGDGVTHDQEILPVAT